MRRPWQVNDDMDFEPGSYNQICDRTGFKVKSNTTQREWTGQTVRTRSWEPRNKQDLLRSIQDRQHVDDPNPEPTQEIFITTTLALELVNTHHWLQLVVGGFLETIA